MTKDIKPKKVPTEQIRNTGPRKWQQHEDDELLGLKASGNTWAQISEFMDIARTTCKERHNKLMKKAVGWNDEMDQQLLKLYQKRREEIWSGVAADLGVPWRAAEDRVWDLGKKKFVKK